MKLEPPTFLTPLAALVSGVALTLLGGCSTLPPVDYTFNPDIPWQELHTFAWAPTRMPTLGDERVDEAALDRHIRSSVEKNLAGHDMRRTEEHDADVLVSYAVGLEDRTFQGDTLPLRWGGGPFEIRYEVGTLQIVLLDPASQHVVWSGRYRSEIGTRTPGSRVDRAVDWVLAGFPPR